MFKLCRSVCHSVCSRGGGGGSRGTILRDVLPLTTERTHPRHIFKLVQLGPHHAGSSLHLYRDPAALAPIHTLSTCPNLFIMKQMASFWNAFLSLITLQSEKPSTFKNLNL